MKKKKKTQEEGKKNLTLKTERATTRNGGKGSESYMRLLAVEGKQKQKKKQKKQKKKQNKQKKTNEQTNKQINKED